MAPVTGYCYPPLLTSAITGTPGGPGLRRRWVIGVDEAGRGSLVGEMIVAAVAVPLDEISYLVEEGVRDSKVLTPQARARLYHLIASRYPFAVAHVTPSEIDSTNLTRLTESAIEKAVSLVLPRVEGVVERIVVDRYGRPRLLHYKLRRLGFRGRILVEEKADSRYPEVSAASIVAKHVRDSRIRVLRSMYGVRGSGYPSDPRTVEWVLETIARGERPPIIRYSWGTLEGTGARVKKKTSGKTTLEDFF